MTWSIHLQKVDADGKSEMFTTAILAMINQERDKIHASVRNCQTVSKFQRFVDCTWQVFKLFCGENLY